jgi:alcohol dehydrogenase
VAIEAVGAPATFELAVQLSRPGGRIANIGVHGEPATLHLEEQWIRNITITTGLVDAYSTPTLLRLVTSGQIDAGRFITHRFALDEFDEAYDVFARAGETGALKVVLGTATSLRAPAAPVSLLTFGPGLAGLRFAAAGRIPVPA